MRTREEIEEVCSVFNLPWTLVQQYVQFGEVFNLLHAGASYLRMHQQGYGAVGVSKKYGKSNAKERAALNDLIAPWSLARPIDLRVLAK